MPAECEVEPALRVASAPTLLERAILDDGGSAGGGDAALDRPLGLRGRRLVCCRRLGAGYASGRERVDRSAVREVLGRVPPDGERVAARPLAAAPLEYHGGPVLHSNAAYAILWVPPSYAFPASYQDLVSQYFRDVAHDSFKPSNPYGVATQYSDGTGDTRRFVSYAVTDGGTIVDADPLPPDGCSNYRLDDPNGTFSTDCITDAQIEAEIASFTVSRHLPRGRAAEYFLFTPFGLTNCSILAVPRGRELL